MQCHRRFQDDAGHQVAAHLAWETMAAEVVDRGQTKVDELAFVQLGSRSLVLDRLVGGPRADPGSHRAVEVRGWGASQVNEAAPVIPEGFPCVVQACTCGAKRL